MDPINIEKIRAMKKYSKSRRQQQQQQLPTLRLYLLMGTFVLCLLLTSPVWFPRVRSILSSFFLTTLPDLVTAFLLSPKCLFIVGNLIVAFLVSESRLALRSDPASPVDDIHEKHVKRHAATSAKATSGVAVIDYNAQLVGGEEEEEGGGEEAEAEEQLHQRVEDFIARVKKHRRLEAKSFLGTDR